ncbi:hypothetical protein [Flintibacter muris]|uniref:hypothetical protein n=1 Tax=Flintibacter muris TaxID=2941327 RepID=UPI00203D2004|nr:hypothetical protein [Flintibacter muris]
MLQLDPRLIADLVGKDLIAFGTGGIGKMLIPYLAQEPDIKLHGVTNSRVTTVDAGTFLDTRLPIRSLDTWAKLIPEATILLCVIRKNEASAWSACEAAGFKKIIIAPFYLIEMLQDLYNPGRMPTAHPMLRMMCLANELRDIHKASFAEFKGCHRGQTVAVVATGPTLNYYTQVKGIPHIGTNASFLKEGMSLDYYFIRHYEREWCDKLKEYNFIKFFARNEWTEQHHDYDRFPEYLIEENNGRRFFTGEPNNELYEDITYYPLMGGYSIIFQALQFAVFTRPKRILLIGCDCSYNGHFDGTPLVSSVTVLLPAERFVPQWIEAYKKLKLFTEQHYPDMEIISVNPVGLKGMFRDMYTESYLEEHPEINRTECEIFDEIEL